ncbi:MAG: dTMP kinase [Sphingomonadales bacterium]|nr:dTMP kinase [Sphingomonadales bacterium]
MIMGRFISIEGGEGAGKSTQIRMLAERLAAQGLAVDITREPGGTEGAEAIRGLLLGGGDDRWGAEAEALLFAAARSDHVTKRIKPALAKGIWVISDRYLDSSRAYQGASLGLSDAAIMQLHAIGSGGFLPERTIILDLPLADARERTQQRDGGESDRIGGRDDAFHQRVRDAFLAIAEAEPHRVRVVDARGTAEDVGDRLFAQIADLLP